MRLLLGHAHLLQQMCVQSLSKQQKSADPSDSLSKKIFWPLRSYLCSNSTCRLPGTCMVHEEHAEKGYVIARKEYYEMRFRKDMPNVEGRVSDCAPVKTSYQGQTMRN